MKREGLLPKGLTQSSLFRFNVAIGKTYYLLNTFKSQYILYSAAEIDKKKIDRWIKVQQSPFQASEGQQMDLQFAEGC